MAEPLRLALAEKRRKAQFNIDVKQKFWSARLEPFAAADGRAARTLVVRAAMDAATDRANPLLTETLGAQNWTTEHVVARLKRELAKRRRALA